MKTITLVIAPINKCNLKCDYCYNDYNEGVTVLDLGLIEYLIDMTFRDNEYVQFVWRGGEPLLLEINYYKKIIKIQKRASIKYGTNYSNAFQTNGTLINGKWINFFKKNNISIGISFDGTLNDVHRGNSEKVIKAFELCKRKRYAAGCIVVVNEENMNLVEQYTYIKQYASSIKFSPCFDEKTQAYSLSSQQYVQALEKLFEFWIMDKNGIPIKPLENYIYSALGIYTRRECKEGMCLGAFLDVDSNGVVRICSHSSNQKYIIGEINDFSSVTEMFNSKSFNSILEKMIVKQKECKEKCEVYNFCMGGCCVKRLADMFFVCEVNKAIYPKISRRIYNIIANREELVQYNSSILKIFCEAVSKNPIVFNRT